MATAFTIPTRLRDARQGAPNRGFWRRFLEMVETSRMRAAECEIARFIQLNGGHMTDSMEREIEKRLGRFA